jgi:amidase
VFNILDYSAVSFPSGIYADKQLDKAGSDTKPLSQVDAQIQAECKWIMNSMISRMLTLN